MSMIFKNETIINMRRTLSLLTLTIVLTILVLPGISHAAGPTIEEFSLPTGNNNPILPDQIVNGSDGAEWFTEYGNDSIGRITSSGSVTTYPIQLRSVPNGITVGPDGALWFVEVNGYGGNNYIGRLTTSGQLTEYPIAVSGVDIADWGNDITTGPDGALWFTMNISGQSFIGRITTSGVITEYALPGLQPSLGGITSGPDGALWFNLADYSGLYIGEITTNGTITTYPLTSQWHSPTNPTSAFITTGPDGNLWFTWEGNNLIGTMTPSGVANQYPIPTQNSYPGAITTNPDGSLWFTEQRGDKIGSITTSGAITEYPVPTANAGPYDITTASDGSMWFTEFSSTNKIGHITFNQTPSAPQNLTAASPTNRSPSLSWSSVLGATSYNIYNNGVKIGSSITNSYTDILANEGTNSYYVTAVNSSGESAPSNTVNVIYDTIAPTINYTVSPAPNSNGWNNSPVTVTFSCSDNSGGSGIASCSPPVTLSSDGANQTVVGTAVDNAGNTSTVTASVNIDTIAPTISNLSFAPDPLAINNSTTLSADLSDLSGIARAEYYTGTDPGQGNGSPMTVVSGVASANVGPYSTPGMYTYYFRAEDNAGNWSQPISITLDVYNPAGGYTAAHGFITPYGPTSNPGDNLPAESGNNVVATFDYTVKYTSSTSTVPTGTATFTWGSTCFSPHSNCFSVTTDTTVSPEVGSLSWLIVPGDNTATFQGTATLSQGSSTIGTNYPFKISVIGTTTTYAGHYLLQVYPIGSDPSTASPIYQASGDLTGGSIVMHR